VERIAIIAPRELFKSKFGCNTKVCTKFYCQELTNVWRLEDIMGKFFDSYDVLIEDWGGGVHGEHIKMLIDEISTRVKSKQHGGVVSRA